MGQGRALGLQLRRWLDEGHSGLIQSAAALSNALCDGLGDQQELRGPIRDLGSRPLFLQVLRQQGAAKATSLAALRQQLAETYSPAVLAELEDLIEAASGLSLPRPPHPEGPPTPSAPPKPAPTRLTREGRWSQLRRDLRSLAPGIAAAAAAAPVLAWLGMELERQLFASWGWSSAVVLAVVLVLGQTLSCGPLRGWRRRWSLDSAGMDDPHQAWRWITAPWIHSNRAEGAANGLLLVLLLGATPLPLSQLLLRYGLTALAAQIPAALVAQRLTVRRRWSGASGPLMALVGLASGLSLLQGRPLGFMVGPLSLPAWVVLLVYGALQLRWVLPSQDREETTGPQQRLLASTACWGLLLGLAWALISRLRELL